MPTTSTRLHRLIAGLALVSLTACGGGAGLANLTDGLGAGLSRTPPKSVDVARGAVTVSGPQGYCVDRAGSRLRAETPFVLLGACASIARDRSAGRPLQQGLLTVAVSPPDGGPGFAATLPQLETFLSSPAGRAALARDGLDTSVEVLETRREGEALLIRLRDTSATALPGTEATYWRGLFEVNGHLVTASVMSFANQPMAPDLAVATLRGVIAETRRASVAG
ncbi:hypothetical protein [Psychromarinibacter halotolerans]|uniref:Dihydroxy-acid dehydratase n=1 Tax=Psychromarinibacter halotolerans TaxID=1775175 RepID=A0ABV7GIW7_9RHOB|nr:hypothetical protein [Psychromarinibacter halotolerans]MAQ81827.1 hypothetical protein [Maritimibacter sp.]MDF0596030.1 hypothetical protein [Psychromarinibacter halotolerans]